jgi:chromosomal replication initiator protein
MNAQDAWVVVLGQLQVQLNQATYSTWVSHARYVAYEEGRLIVSVPNAYSKDWLEKFLAKEIGESFEKLIQCPTRVEVIVWDPYQDEDDVRNIFGVQDDFLSEYDGIVNPDKSFEAFVETEANQRALFFAKEILREGTNVVCSYLIVGNSGTGKTHLVQAMANQLIRRHIKLIYVTAEQFTNELIRAIQTHTTYEFREKYRRCDVLIIEDIDFFEGKDATQEEFVYTYEELALRNRLVIMTARRLPNDMAVNYDFRRCINRWFVTEIQPFSSVDLDKLIDQKAKQMHITLTPDSQTAIRIRIGGDPSMIEGSLLQISRYAQMTQSGVSAELVGAVLRGRESSLQGRNLDSHRILEGTARYYGLTEDDLRGKRRTKAINAARQAAIYLARTYTEASFSQIGAVFGGRDHSTILHGYTKAVETLKSDPILQAEVITIRDALLEGRLPDPGYATPHSMLEERDGQLVFVGR